MEDFDKLKDNIEPLEKHGIKVCYYKEIYTQQRPQAFEVLFNLIKKYNIDFIFELGTADGGVTQFINDLEIDSFHVNDKNQSNWFERCTSKNKLIGDIFGDEVEAEIKALTEQSYQRRMWLFDNGDKCSEVKKYNYLIKPGDLVLVHDFAPTVKDHEWLKANNIWLWHESSEAGLPLESLERIEEFDSTWQNAVWGAYTKK